MHLWPSGIEEQELTIPTIVTLSSIPPRFEHLWLTLLSLLNQSVKVDEIRINIPRSYRRFADWDGTLPSVPEGVSIHRVDEDHGPATKVLPTIRELRGQNVHVLFCDDDRIYPRHWHASFKRAAAARPETCIVGIGETFPDIADSCRAPDRLPRGHYGKKGLSYRLKELAGLFLIKPAYPVKSGYVDQLSGFAGVLVKPDWFDDLVHAIPDDMWMVDDPWLSGHLERRGIPIWMDASIGRPGFAESDRIHALLDMEEIGHSRIAADIRVIDYFRCRYGIWQKCGAVDGDVRHRFGTMRELARLRQEELAQNQKD